MSKIRSRTVSVALCIFNGLPYLPEQLDSILKQTTLPDELVICDDNSVDLSVSTIRSLTEQAPFKVSFYENQTRLGPTQNFSKAIDFCKGDYVALCDQDDIWLPEKLDQMMQHIMMAEDKYGSSTPLLVHSDLTVIDEAGSVIAPSFMKLQKIKSLEVDVLKNLLIQNFVTGCTVLINRPLIDVALPIPEEAVMHDWWFALVVAARGKIIYEPQPTVLYRKHGKNVIGAKGYYSEENVARLLDIKRLEIELAGTINQALTLLNRLESLPGGDIHPNIVRFLNAARQGGIRAVAAALKGGIRKAGLLRTILFYMLLFKGSYKDELSSN